MTTEPPKDISDHSAGCTLRELQLEHTNTNELVSIRWLLSTRTWPLSSSTCQAPAHNTGLFSSCYTSINRVRHPRCKSVLAESPPRRPSSNTHTPPTGCVHQHPKQSLRQTLEDYYPPVPNKQQSNPRMPLVALPDYTVVNGMPNVASETRAA